MSLKTTRHSISPMKAPTAWRIGCTNGLHPCAHSLAVAAWWIQSTPQESGAAGLRTSGTHCMSANLVDSVFAEPARSIQHASTKYDDLCDSGWRARGNTALSSSSGNRECQERETDIFVTGDCDVLADVTEFVALRLRAEGEAACQKPVSSYPTDVSSVAAPMFTSSRRGQSRCAPSKPWCPWRSSKRRSIPPQECCDSHLLTRFTAAVRLVISSPSAHYQLDSFLLIVHKCFVL